MYLEVVRHRQEVRQRCNFIHLLHSIQRGQLEQPVIRICDLAKRFKDSVRSVHFNKNQRLVTLEYRSHSSKCTTLGMLDVHDK